MGFNTYYDFILWNYIFNNICTYINQDSNN